ncbi:hypothetical protein TSOC_009462 [Tetrabaena socialis]|uniref:Ankyrin repeat domain-containing protein n=1 Tax=Tetrabaena socialis TaxID=47790 RepID=A0A2J7ZVV7_9CHLO|nr:hypothetical protein TSOC_009462 [Tetrabaena socialis]|eukprot:PNH04378.1 hypothetical protein TSOC_009462 [Tetrabaena socialis]
MRLPIRVSALRSRRRAAVAQQQQEQQQQADRPRLPRAPAEAAGESAASAGTESPSCVSTANGSSSSSSCSGFRVWLPELVQGVSRCLPRNEVACTLRLVDAATAAQLRGPQERTIRLSLPAPHPEFSHRWGGPRATRSLTLRQRVELPCLVARSGVIANLEVLLARGDDAHVLEAQVLEAAAGAGQLEACRWLRQRGCPAAGGEALEQAARGGHLAVCEWLLDTGCPFGPGAACQAALGGNVGLMDWLLASGPRPKPSNLLRCAAAGCDLPALQRLHAAFLGGAGELLPDEEYRPNLVACAATSPTADWRGEVEWLEARGYWARAQAGAVPGECGGVQAHEVCSQAAMRDDGRDRLQWLVRRGYPLTWWAVAKAASRGDVDVLRMALDAGVEADEGAVHISVLRATSGGHVAFLRALRSAPGLSASALQSAASQAASRGQLRVLQWALDELGAAEVLTAGCFAGAVASGSLEVMAWLQQRGCPMDAFVFSTAAEAGSEEQLEWLAAWGCPMEEDGEPYSWGLRNGGLPMLQCLQRLGCRWGPPGLTFTRAVAFGQSRPAACLEVLQWLLDAGCPVDCDMALQYCQDERVRAWLREQQKRRQPQPAARASRGTWGRGWRAAR